MKPRNRLWKESSLNFRARGLLNPGRAFLSLFAIVLAASWLGGPQRGAAAGGQVASRSSLISWTKRWRMRPRSTRAWSC
jgi:hypothetical protein